jgi:hypothetical protein
MFWLREELQKNNSGLHSAKAVTPIMPTKVLPVFSVPPGKFQNITSNQTKTLPFMPIPIRRLVISLLFDTAHLVLAIFECGHLRATAILMNI